MFLKHLSIFLLVSFFISFSSAGFCVASDLYTVKDLSVDVKAGDAVSAQSQAIASAQNQAMKILAKRLLSSDQYHTFEIPDLSVIQDMIKGFQVADEKMASNRYIAKLTFKFSKQKVTQFFNDLGKVALSEVSKPTLILPFYQKGEFVYFWEDENIWMHAWKEWEGESSVVPVVLPLGDLQDRSDIPDLAAVTSSRDKLFAMAQRSGAYQVVPAIFVVEDNQPNKARIFLFGYNSDPSMQLSETLDIEVSDQENLMQKGIEDIVSLLEDRWKEMSLMRSSFQNQIQAHVVFSDLSQWVSIKKSLDDVSVIEELTVLSLNQGGAIIQARFKGSLDGVKFSLSQKKLSMNVGANGFYYISKK